MMCDHSGTYSGASQYLREVGELRLVLLCDRCGAERQEVGRVKYRPDASLPERDAIAGASAIGGAGAAAAA